MRTLLLAALSLSALTPSHDADACGNYRPEPRVMRLSTHFIVDSATDKRRTFVVWGDATPPTGIKWRMLAPRSYDYTQIADGATRKESVTFTLVGPQGTRVVSTNKLVYLSKSWDFDKPQHAFDLGDVEGFSIAIEGIYEHASFTALQNLSTRFDLRAWVREQGVEPYDATSIYQNRVAGTEFETVTVFPKNGQKMRTFIKHGIKNLGSYEGTAMGAVTIDGMMNLVISDGAHTTQVFLTNATLSRI